MKRICSCGQEYETAVSKKVYCSGQCQVKFSNLISWGKTKQDYKFRCSRLLALAKNRAKTKGLAFNLTLEYLDELWQEQEGCCVISGRYFDLSKPGECTVQQNAPSLDRIKPADGYVKGNVRFVCYQVNTALNEYGEEALLNLCKDIIKNYGAVN